MKLVSRYISSIPLENARKLHCYYEKGLLKIGKSNANNFRYNNGKIILNNHDLHYDGLIIAAGIKSHCIKKDNSNYIFTSTDNQYRLEEAEFNNLRKNGAWLIGSLSGSVYPIVNYLRFCVGQTNDFVDFIEKKDYENSSY